MRAKLFMVTMAIIVAVYTLLGVAWLQQLRERESLASQLSAASESLREYGTAASREKRLAAAKARLLAEQGVFPKKLSSGATLNDVLQLAKESQVKIIDVTTQPGSDEKRGDHTYFSLSIHLQVAGSLPELQAFLSRLEKGALKAVAIDEISITGMKESPAASLGFSVYARR